MTTDEIRQKFHASCKNDEVQDFTCNGECSKCGQCCSAFLPLTRTEFKRLRKLAKKQGIYVHEGADVDCTCPFLDGNNRCSIYEDRPMICRLFTCHEWQKKGTED